MWAVTAWSPRESNERTQSISSSDGARGGLAEREMRVPCGMPIGCAGGALWTPQRVLRARVRKNGSGGGSSMAGKSGWPPAQGCPEWGPRGAAQRGVFWGRCAGIRACLGKYIQCIQIQNWIYTRYIQYIQIPTYTYTYIHIHSPDNQSLEVFFVRQWRLHATPLHRATYPDHLQRGSGRARRARNACGMPIG